MVLFSPATCNLINSLFGMVFPQNLPGRGVHISSSKTIYMKKIFVGIAAILFFSFTSYAQRTNFGVKAGVNLASVDIDDDDNNEDDFESRTGFHAGVLAHIHVNSKVAIQPELVYSLQGGERNDDNRLNLGYLNLPVLVQFMISDGFRLQTGPQVGFLLGAERKLGDVEIDVSDDYNTVDWAWSFGASYIFASGFGLDARYNLGLCDIHEDNDLKAKNRVFQAGLFYQFRNSAGRKK